MLINTNIKRIVGGGCEIKEVRYMDNVVWKKRNEYKIILNPDSLSYVKVYINSKGISTYSESNVEINDSSFYLKAEFTNRDFSKTVKIFINGRVVYNKNVVGEYERDYKGPIYAYDIRESFNTSILYSDKVNSIKVVIA